MPLGLNNAPRTFQKIIQKLLGHLDMVMVCLEYILIYSKPPEEHEEHIKTALDILKENNSKINTERVNFDKKQ